MTLFIGKYIFSSSSPKVEDAITEYGQSLLPIINAISAWGRDHVKHMSELQRDTKLLCLMLKNKKYYLKLYN
ncbi:winged helix-turn-helix transcriptional regulator [Niallia taxi]|uniref:winged helix-turn-helix transcriptional regulator n=1 Tax=Niallia taxi TaxID=2499688 RepID=UPI00399D2076